jgi:putative transcriptional regulator
MRVSYAKLWHILLSKHMTKETFRKECGLSSNTIAKLGKGLNVTTDVLVKICKTLKCDISDIMELISNEEER